jgi:hypothetical protein
MMRKDGIPVVNSMATNAVNLCALSLADTSEVEGEHFFCITSTARLVYNSCPVKLTSVSVLSAGMDMARREIDEYYISNAMGSRNTMLLDICKSILGEKDLDAVWCSWVLVNYLCSHPRGRDLLRASGLTDVDLQSAIAFERYGGEEIRRRIRQRRSNPNGSEHPKKRRRPSSEGDERDGEAASGRKRPSKAVVPSATSDAHSIVEFWHGALQSQDASVLHTLAAHNKRTARDAALSTLARQTEGTDVGDNAVLQSVSLKNAIKSAKALVSFVGRRVDDTPVVLLCRVKNNEFGNMERACATLRIDKEAASTALHACSMAERCLRPKPGVRMAIAWSHATKKLMPTTESAATMPGILERYREMEIADAKDRQTHSGRKFALSARAIREKGIMESFVDVESEMAFPRHVTGTTRSFISAVTFMSVNYTHVRAAEAMFNEARSMMDGTTQTSSAGSSTINLPCVLQKSQDVKARSEPLCTPSSPLAVGICVNETLRRWMAGKTRRNDPCMKHLGFSSPSEVAKEMPGIMSSEPMPLLTITDMEMERTGDVKWNTPVEGEAQVAMGLHVCGDGAVRIADVIEQLCKKFEGQDPRIMKESRAALYVAASQASYIGVVASSLVSGYTNASIASSKKISCPDVNKLMLLSPFDCYVAGLCNIQRSFDPGPYSGTYGCRLDTGFTMHGLLAHNWRSDKRQHGNCSLSEATANELALAFGESHWMVYDDPAGGEASTKYYTSTPITTRGIPHNFVPGLHSLLNDYCDFIESYRDVSDRSHCDTVDSVMCLPFSPWTQALNPDLEPTADVSLRTCFREQLESSVATGRGYLPDATPERSALVTEPLFRRPCQVSSGDCPFATAYESMDTFFNACNTLALLARTCAHQVEPDATPPRCLELLHDVVSNFVSGSARQADWLECWAADALVLLNVLYPSNVVIGELGLLNGIARAAPACHRAARSGAGSSTCSTLDQCDGIDGVDARMVRMFWSAFQRTNADECAWKWGLQPLLQLILENDGSHAVDSDKIAKFRAALENAVRAVWLVYSEDGKSPPPKDHPTHEAASPLHVARHHIDPVFVGNSETGLVQRACCVGLKPHTYRQILSELLGASIDGVVCNAALNEGGLGLRVSSDPTILDEDGNERTDKSISPVQTEGDESAYGKRKDKLAGAMSQKLAWDTNALLQKPLYTAIEPPRSSEIRGRGEFGFSQFFQTEYATMAADGQRMSKSFAHAKALVVESSNPRVACKVNACL